MRGWAVGAVLALCACSDKVESATPVGGQQASLAEQQRFVRRLYLDLTGKPPGEAAMAAAIDQLAAGNTAATRAALARELLESADFATIFVGELETSVFGGEPIDSRYGLVCGVTRDNEPPCNTCAPAAPGDPCGDCACPVLIQLAAEQESLHAAAADLDGLSTGAIERRFGDAQVLRRSFGDGGAYTDALFLAFLGRNADPDEQRNGRSLFFGALFDPGRPAGVLFHRHGSNSADLVAILFESENYREAVVDRAFSRYLGRAATPAELAHFSARVDAADPDARPIIEAVVSSREYFAQ
jgi:hypothetical protein